MRLGANSVLTRPRYLTEVERQLAEARTLVQQYASAPNFNLGPSNGDTVGRHGHTELSDSPLPPLVDPRFTPQVASAVSSPNPVAVAPDYDANTHGAPSLEGASSLNSLNRDAQKPANLKAITFPLEPTPASVSGNLEWDERDAARNQTPADGMGNLIDGGNEGYLGMSDHSKFA